MVSIQYPGFRITNANFILYHNDTKLEEYEDYNIRFIQNGKERSEAMLTNPGELTVKILHGGYSPFIADTEIETIEFPINILPMPEPSKPEDPYKNPIDLYKDVDDIGVAKQQGLVFCDANVVIERDTADSWFFYNYPNESTKEKNKRKKRLDAGIELTSKHVTLPSGEEMPCYRRYKELEKDKDYTVTYKVTEKPTDVRVDVTFKGIGNYTGEFTISSNRVYGDVSKILVDNKTIRVRDTYYGKAPTFEYYVEYYEEYLDKNGNIRQRKKTKWDSWDGISKWSKKKSLSGKLNSELVTNNVLEDWGAYGFYYKNNLKIGTAQITVKGCGYNVGRSVLHYKVVRAPLPKIRCINCYNPSIEDYNCVRPMFANENSEWGDGMALERNVDYKIVSYELHKKTKIAKMTVKGIGKYKGTRTIKYKIK